LTLFKLEHHHGRDLLSACNCDMLSKGIHWSEWLTLDYISMLWWTLGMIAVVHSFNILYFVTVLFFPKQSLCWLLISTSLKMLSWRMKVYWF
jgi:hypothetical protein